MLCFENDEKIREYREQNPIWITTLNNGQVVYGAEGYDIRPTWSALQEYCDTNLLSIKSLRFGFRSNMFNLADDKDGYFFCKGIRASLSSVQQQQYWLLGYVEGDNILISKWFIPEMINVETEIRKVEDSTKPCLILKH
jgi:hypothetical protein